MYFPYYDFLLLVVVVAVVAVVLAHSFSPRNVFGLVWSDAVQVTASKTDTYSEPTHTPGQSQTVRSRTQAANRHRKIVQSLKIPVGRIQYLECVFNVRSVRYFEFIFETFRSNTEPKAHFMQANQNRKTSCRMGRFQILKLYIFDKCVHHCTFV